MLPEHDYVPAPETPAQIYAAYLVHLQRRDRGNTAYAQAARSFLRRWPRVQTWADIPLQQQLAANCSTRPFITFLMVSRRLQPGYDYLVHRKLCSLWHELTDSCLQPDLDQFLRAAAELGFSQRVASAIGSQIIARLLIQTARPWPICGNMICKSCCTLAIADRNAPAAVPGTIAAPPTVPARSCSTSASSTTKHLRRSPR
ncbi:hypothetical protein [Mycobacterium sp. SMC-8]|uniref:hypothetical protein n=1 Tax=Mycobacterium sp. SMC-8 TaxID=2857060 RepID=UPI0021B3B38C|nr:hypothetical protein [Mycobacterium sp. SMC-8]